MQVDENTFIVNSMMSYKAFIAWVWTEFEQHKYLTFSHRIGEDRSLDQNSLFHVWLAEYCAHLAGIHKREVSAGMIEFLKRKIKKAYYRETGFPWMLSKLVDPKTKEEGETIFASSKDYKVGEMFLFLTWFQNHAANDGLLLESRGQYQKIQKEQAGA